jgi:hypothetical protein
VRRRILIRWIARSPERAQKSRAFPLTLTYIDARHTTEICSPILRIKVCGHSSRRYSLRRNAFGVMPNFLRKAKVR